MLPELSALEFPVRKPDPQHFMGWANVLGCVLSLGLPPESTGKSASREYR